VWDKSVCLRVCICEREREREREKERERRNSEIFIGYVSFIHLFGSTGVELRALCLLGQCSTSWIMLPTLFALVILEIGSCFLPWPTWFTILFYAFSLSWDGRHATVPSYCWDVVLWTISLGSPQIVFLLVSVSQTTSKDLWAWATDT
jgi:hypothetical protein